ncbi:nucleotide triphosphate diphosphatase NUDT15 [Lingula anatina]|uniref:Nucleotide triphosphate diphosphatase NUDT15 n=1 Tax=Lingula anatina TaxID=7574 RepID=A0A1S3JV11_LINAN|nr:nucleotide triphosphate diphosphatase NUDT15 [Lingula anatina]|eukprot:XP_013414215.1 nucleotide triphosphate diphosphatase NUDT15 [Lingula anatina]
MADAEHENGFDVELRPKVGVGVFIISPDHPNCVLIGLRNGSRTGKLYGLPGGHLEFGEEWNECAVREVQEETGLRLTRVDFATVVNVVWREHNLHYVDIMMLGVVNRGCEPQNLEPDKCEGWQWCDWDNFPAPGELFLPLKLVREQGFNPFRTKSTDEL